MRAWRISNYTDLSGKGGLFAEGRWHPRGVQIVYCADHPSTSLLEILVHASRLTVPDTYQLIEIDIPDEVQMADPDLSNFPDWRNIPEETRKIGLDFIRQGLSVVLRVPSVVMPKATNIIVNPLHAEAARLKVVGVDRYPFDSRLFG